MHGNTRHIIIPCTAHPFSSDTSDEFSAFRVTKGQQPGLQVSQAFTKSEFSPGGKPLEQIHTLLYYKHGGISYSNVSGLGFQDTQSVCSTCSTTYQLIIS